MQRKINRSISFAIDNMYYVNFRIQEQESVPWCGEIQKQRLEVLGNTFNLHSNSTYAQEIWSLNQFICVCLRESKRVSNTHIQKHFILSQNSICFSPYNWLSNWTSLMGHSNWDLVCDLEWDQKGTNKTLASMSLGLFCQLLTSPKLPLIIFNITYEGQLIRKYC